MMKHPPQRWQRVLVCVAEPAYSAAALVLLLIGSDLLFVKEHMILSSPGDIQSTTPVHNVYWTCVQLPKNVIFVVFTPRKLC